MRHGEPGWITLHPGEFALLWTELGLGELPAVLEIAPAGRTAATRAELIATANESLADRHLGTVSQPAHDLEAMLQALAYPTIWLDLEITGAGSSFRAIGADGPRGTVTVGAGETEVRIGPVRPSELVATLLTAAAPRTAGLGSPGNIRISDYRRACRAGEYEGTTGFLSVLRDAGARPAEASTFLRAVSQAVSGGWFGASVWRDDTWVRVPDTLNWVDTGDGRYVVQCKGDWVTVTPADQARLLSMTEDWVAGLT